MNEPQAVYDLADSSTVLSEVDDAGVFLPQVMQSWEVGVECRNDASSFECHSDLLEIGCALHSKLVGCHDDDAVTTKTGRDIRVHVLVQLE